MQHITSIQELRAMRREFISFHLQNKSHPLRDSIRADEIEGWGVDLANFGKHEIYEGCECESCCDDREIVYLLEECTDPRKTGKRPNEVTICLSCLKDFMTDNPEYSII